MRKQMKKIGKLCLKNVFNEAGQSRLKFATNWSVRLHLRQSNTNNAGC